MSLKFVSVILIGAALASISSAAPTIFSGTDPGTQFGDPRPNSNLAASNFDTIAASIHPMSAITWEQFAVGTQGPYSPFAGVTVTQTNVDIAGGFNGIAGANTANIGYNTTFGGSKFLQVAANFNTTDTTTVFTFSGGVNAFGFYITGHENFPGDLSVTFTDGAGVLRNYAITKPATVGGVAATGFWGFVDAPNAMITSITILDRGDRTSNRDVFGIDDIRFTPVPEPGTVVCLLIGGSAMLIRRRKK
jgi:hypothetical protein